MKSLNLNNLHHAYLVIGAAEKAEKVLLELFSLAGSPDYFVYKEPLFGVDEARKVSSASLGKAFTNKKIFFIAPERITLQAQNALLKTFEEPNANTHFFLVVRGEELIIPTLRSRCQVVRVEHSAPANEAERFLKMPLRKRLEFAKKFVEDEKNLSVFLDGLLAFLRLNGSSAEPLEGVYKVRLLSDMPSVSSRLVLEHLALIL